MSQQVNLYRDDVVQSAPRLGSRTLLQLLAALVLALALVGGALGVHGLVRSHSLENLRARLVEGERGLAELEARYARHADTAALEARIARLQGELQSREQLAALIRASSTNRSGFSPQLEGLALGRIPGMWLDSFRVSGGGRGLALGGRALRPDAVPGFVLELGRQPVFAGTEFEALVLERPQDSAALRFEIRTAEPGAGAAKEKRE